VFTQLQHGIRKQFEETSNCFTKVAPNIHKEQTASQNALGAYTKALAAYTKQQKEIKAEAEAGVLRRAGGRISQFFHELTYGKPMPKPEVLANPVKPDAHKYSGTCSTQVASYLRDSSSVNPANLDVFDRKDLSAKHTALGLLSKKLETATANFKDMPQTGMNATPEALQKLVDILQASKSSSLAKSHARAQLKIYLDQLKALRTLGTAGACEGSTGTVTTECKEAAANYLQAVAPINQQRLQNLEELIFDNDTVIAKMRDFVQSKTAETSMTDRLAAITSLKGVALSDVTTAYAKHNAKRELEKHVNFLETLRAAGTTHACSEAPNKDKCATLAEEELDTITKINKAKLAELRTLASLQDSTIASMQSITQNLWTTLSKTNGRDTGEIACKKVGIGCAGFGTGYAVGRSLVGHKIGLFLGTVGAIGATCASEYYGLPYNNWLSVK
jgi:hypothetical protein